jgi:flagellum-specific peptidoglycan hydrolase FlgJ
MTNPTYRLLLGAGLALFVGAAGAQYAPSTNSAMAAQSKATSAQPSQQPTDKMSANSNGSAQSAADQQNKSAQRSAAAEPMNTMRHAHKSTMHQHENVSPEEKSYRQALRQCVEERNDSQRDTCIDNAIVQHEPNS